MKNIPPEHDAYKIHLPQNAPDNIKAATTALDSDDPAERKSAIERLVQANHPLALEALAAAIHHSQQDVRTEAALTLIEFNDLRAVPGFTNALKDENENVNSRASKALKKLIEANNTGLLSAGRVGLLEALNSWFGQMVTRL